MNETIYTTWIDLIANRNSAKKYFEVDHPLRLLFGCDDLGRAVFVLISATKTDVPEVSREILVDLKQRDSDSHWVLTLTLTDSNLFDVFHRLCSDLVDRSKLGATESVATRLLLYALADWQILLRPARTNRLSMEELRGVVAEVWFGFRILTRMYTVEDVCASWVGPLGAPQDYSFADGSLFEVKSRRPGTSLVKISSSKQLDPPLNRPLCLAVVELDQSEAGITDAFTLVGLIDSIRSTEGLNAVARKQFSDRIQDAGIDLQDAYYSETWLKTTSYECYSVQFDFPAIRSSAISPVIESVTYSVNTRSLNQFLTLAFHKPESQDD